MLTTQYAALRCVTEEDKWEQWTLFILRAVEETALATHALVLGIRALMLETTDKIRTELPNIYSKDLVEVLFSQLYCNIPFLERAGIVKREAASKYFKELSRIGVLSAPVEIGRESY